MEQARSGIISQVLDPRTRRPHPRSRKRESVQAQTALAVGENDLRCEGPAIRICAIRLLPFETNLPSSPRNATPDARTGTTIH